MNLLRWRFRIKGEHKYLFPCLTLLLRGGCKMIPEQIKGGIRNEDARRCKVMIHLATIKKKRIVEFRLDRALPEMYNPIFDT